MFINPDVRLASDLVTMMLASFILVLLNILTIYYLGSALMPWVKRVFTPAEPADLALEAVVTK